MKKVIAVFFFMMIMASSVYAVNMKLPNLGMVSQLVDIKYGTEEYLLKILNDDTKSKDEKSIARKNYNAVRVQIDRIIYQLIIDMRAKNSIKRYRQLNRYYKAHQFSESTNESTPNRMYALALEKVYITYKEEIVNGGKLTESSLDADQILSSIELGWTIIKDIQEMRGKKVDGVVEILNNIRLSSVSEFEKGDDKKS